MLLKGNSLLYEIEVENIDENIYKIKSYLTSAILKRLNMLQ